MSYEMVGFNMYCVKPHGWSKFWMRMLKNILTVRFFRTLGFKLSADCRQLD